MKLVFLNLYWLIIQTFNPTKGTLGRPYDSTQGFTGGEQVGLSVIIIGFGAYVSYKVWRSSKKIG